MKWAQHDMVWNNICEQTLVVIFYRPILSFVMPSNLVTDHTSEAKSQMQVFILVVFIFIFGGIYIDGKYLQYWTILMEEEKFEGDGN